MGLIYLDKESAIQKISERCSESLLQAIKGTCLYFAEESDLEFGLMRPEPMSYEEDERYQLLHILMENTAGWAKFPKREKSIITSTSSVPMDKKHTVFIMLPVNGTKLGICAEDDFYTSFNKIEKEFNVKDAYEFEQTLKQLLNCVNHFVHDSDIEDWTNADVIKVCKMFDNIMTSMKGSYNFKLYYETTTGNSLKQWIKKGSLYEQICHFMDPELNGFDVKKITEIKKQKNREVWFSNECYVITKNLFNEILDSGKLAHILAEDR